MPSPPEKGRIYEPNCIPLYYDDIYQKKLYIKFQKHIQFGLIALKSTKSNDKVIKM